MKSWILRYIRISLQDPKCSWCSIVEDYRLVLWSGDPITFMIKVLCLCLVARITQHDLSMGLEIWSMFTPYIFNNKNNNFNSDNFYVSDWGYLRYWKLPFRDDLWFLHVLTHSVSVHWSALPVLYVFYYLLLINYLFELIFLFPIFLSPRPIFSRFTRYTPMKSRKTSTFLNVLIEHVQ